MVRRLARDESGMAMGLAIMVMVIVGVMGAGLLVFVRNDLEAVVEVNQGQKAFDIADAGVQTAKQQLLGDKIPAHYDVDDPANANYLNTGCNVDSADPGESIARVPAAENWSPEAGGQTRTFAGGSVTVTIRWLNPTNPPPGGMPVECQAPELEVPPMGTDYFKVVSTGRYGDATRRIETIYETYNSNVPRAYYTPGKINIRGSACISGVSLFSSFDSADGTPAIDFDGDGGCAGGGHIEGPDLAYGAWNEPPSSTYNTTARSGPTCSKTLSGGTVVTKTCAGVAAVGEVQDSATGRLGTLDYDTTTSPRFVATPSSPPPAQPASEITFPFDVAAQPDPDQLCDEVRGTSNYITENGTGVKQLNSWPTGSSYNTIVCYEFANANSNNELRWSVNPPGATNISSGEYSGCKEPRQRGTLVVRGGGFTVAPKTALFEGVVVVRGPVDQDSEISNTDETGLSGNTCLDGFVNSTGPITITGSVKPSGSVEVNNRPGFYGVRTWGWRELYE
jgi:Tfp pilus assembly protein PilX